MLSHIFVYTNSPDYVRQLKNPSFAHSCTVIKLYRVPQKYFRFKNHSIGVLNVPLLPVWVQVGFQTRTVVQKLHINDDIWNLNAFCYVESM